MRIRVLRVIVAGVIVSALAGVGLHARQGDADLTKAPRISQEEFKKLRASGPVLVVDVRDADSYKAGHIPGAISIPLDEVASPEHVKELKGAAKPIVTYCA